MTASVYPDASPLPQTLERPRGISSLVLAAVIIPCVVAAFAAFSDTLWHWFLIPVTLCGILVGADALDWVRGRVGVFDPVGIIGLLGLHFFWLAPLLHVYRDVWMPEVIPPDDWTTWIGWMALWNAGGLVLYRVGRRFFARDLHPRTDTSWQIEPHLFWIAVTAVLVISALGQFFVYLQYGGILGYITSIVAGLSGMEAVQGMGWLLTLVETFPTFAIIAWVVYARDKEFARSWVIIGLVLLLFFTLKMLFGGLRGSRGHTIWGLLSAVGIIHFWIRPIPRKFFLLGGALLFVFMYGYGLFKAGGLDALQAIGDEQVREDIIAQSGRNLDYVILGDLGRSDVQAYVLYKLSLPDSDFEYARGRTYIGGLVSIVPSALWQNRPLSKLKEGTELIYGAGTFAPNEFWSSRQYGLAGEAMLNFGVLAVPVAFLVFGLVVGRVQQLQRQWRSYDARWFLFPALSVTCFVLLASDSDNITLILLQQVAIPGLFLWVVTRRIPAGSASGADT